MSKPLIFACCGGEVAAHILAAAAKAGDYDFAYSEGFADARLRLQTRPANLVFIEIAEGALAPGFTELTGFLGGKSIPFVAVCREAKHGFDGINAGAANMLIIPRENSSPAYIVSQLTRMIKAVDMETGESRAIKQDIISPITRIVAIGASTGGAEAVLAILKDMPADAPPIVAVMHMPPVFTRIYAERLNSISRMSVWEASDGDRLRPGLCLIARGDRHLTLHKDDAGFYVSVFDGGLVGGFKPSVDKFFSSCACSVKGTALGVILTGMGADGAKGLKEMRDAGSFTIGQNEASSIVYGMPKAAYDLGAVSVQAPLSEICALILSKS
ncbi:MAG: chemotaxis protein CheB [Clostridiales bacterium]|jgi:two-component system chemotaxis response regulator CheB|nr:chemotaxis protein CheB [Clostridiales bacterium]